VPITTSRPHRPRPIAAALAAAVAVAVAGCGSSSGGADTDPASVVPAGAVLYVEAVVRPEGDERTNAESVLRKVLDTTDPRGKIVELLDRAGKEKGIVFARDVDPWLGDRVGVAVTSLKAPNGDTDVVLVAASTDAEAAAKAMERLNDDAETRSHREIDYRVDRKDATATAVVGDSVVVATTERALKTAIDASEESSLADSDALKKARSSVTDERIGFAYIDAQRFLAEAIDASGRGADIAPFLGSLRDTLPKTIAAALSSDADAIRVDAVALGAKPIGPEGASGAEALAGLPADAWLGIGVGDLGATLDGVLEQLSSSGLAGVGVEALLGQLRQQIGLDVRRDLLAWMGDAAIFAAGTSRGDLRGALVVKSKDPAATRRAVVALARLAGDSSPLAMDGVDEGFQVVGADGSPDAWVAAAGDRFVIAVGQRRALEEVIAPDATLASTPAFTAAAAKLGGGVRPSFFLDMTSVTALLGDVAGSDPDFAAAKPYLDAFAAIAGGAKREGDDATRVRIVVTLR